LILIVQNATINKMTMRNVGIVFSPTLGIPAGVFSLMLGEFNRVFNVDALDLGPDPDDESGQDRPPDFSRRNSRQYTDAAADKMLGLAGRTLAGMLPSIVHYVSIDNLALFIAPAEETQSDGDDYSLDESGTETTEGDGTLESSGRSSPVDDDFDRHLIVTSPDTPIASRSKASHAAATLGLNINLSERGNRHSRIIGLPNSPRLHQIQMNSPMQTPK
jgi:RalA-binding protein 1